MVLKSPAVNLTSASEMAASLSTLPLTILGSVDTEELRHPIFSLGGFDLSGLLFLEPSWSALFVRERFHPGLCLTFWP